MHKPVNFNNCFLITYRKTKDSAANNTLSQSIMQRIVYQIENTTIAFPVYFLLTYVS